MFIFIVCGTQRDFKQIEDKTGEEFLTLIK